MAPSVAPQIKALLTTLSSAPSNLSCPCEALRLPLRWGGEAVGSCQYIHSQSEGQLVLLGPSLSQRYCWRCVCVSALSRVIAMCQRAWPSLTRGICRLVCAAWVAEVLGCPVLSSPYLPLDSKDAGHYYGHIPIVELFTTHSGSTKRF